MISFLFYFLIFSNIALYLSLSMFHISYLSTILPIILSLIISTKINQKITFKPKIKSLFLIGLPLFIANLIIQYPLIQNININGFQFVSYSSATDFFKHLYTVTSIKSFGLPPKHPYMPLSNFKYYYFYYLLPSGLSFLLPSHQHQILYFYVALTNLLSVVILTWLVGLIIKNKLAKIIAAGFIFYGQGLDIIPTLIGPKQSVNRLIDMWSIKTDLGLRIDNPFTAFIWTPQHFFSAVTGLMLIFYLAKSKKINIILAAILLSFTIGSSIFVAISICFLISLIFLFRCKLRLTLIKTIVLSAIILFPFLVYISSSSGHIFSFFSYNPYHFIKDFKFLNFLICLLIDFGPIYFVNLLIILSTNNKQINKKIILLSLLVIPVLSLFVKSPNFNDFGLRANLPIQIISAVVFAYIFQFKKRLKPILFSIFLINISISCLGFLYEVKVRWQDRQILDVDTSQLIVSLRKFDRNKTISVLGKGEWVYKIPPLAFKPVYASDLYDSANYFDHQSQAYTDFFTTNIALFKANQALSQCQLVQNIQRELDSLNLIFNSLNTDYTLINKKIFVKQDINPYFHILINLLGANYIKLTNNFYLIDNKSAVDKLSQNKITINPTQRLNLFDKTVNLNQGLYVISVCNSQPVNQCFLFEPEDHYTLFDNCLDTSQCAGNIFFQPSQTDNALKINTKNIQNEIYINPITIN